MAKGEAILRPSLLPGNQLRAPPVIAPVAPPKENAMTKLSIGVIAAALALSASGCDRHVDQTARDRASPPRSAQPPDKDLQYRDPSVPPNPPENRPTEALPGESK